MWSHDGQNSSGTQPRTTLSRHLSLSGSAPKTAFGSGFNNNANSGGYQQDWPDSPLSGTGSPLPHPSELREGRSRTRPFANNNNGSNSSNTHNSLARSLSIASSASERERSAPSGIAVSNMSPFVRDLGQLHNGALGSGRGEGGMNGGDPASSIGRGIAPPPVSNPNIYSASYSTSSDFYMRNRRPSSGLAGGGGSALGAVGSGRAMSASRRRESFWDSHERSALGYEDSSSNANAFLDEDLEEDDDEEDYAPPTKSGATSRRHSVATFTPSTAISPPAIRSQFGFNIPSSAFTPVTSTSKQQGGFGDPLSGQSSASLFGNSGAGSSRLDDDDLLATDLSNALQLNLDAQAAKQQQQQQAYSSQYHLPSPRIPDSRAVSLPNQPTFPQSIPIGQGNSPSSNTHQGSPYGSVGSSRPPASTLTPNPNINSNSTTAGVSPSSPSQVPPSISAGAPSASATAIRSTRPNRAASASGDPYSPSASASRFLATAHNVQPPPLPPQTGITRDQSPGYSSSPAVNAAIGQQQQEGLWPGQGPNVFSHGSPHFRSGTLPPPESLQQPQQQQREQPKFGQATQVQRGFTPGQGSGQAGYGYAQQQQDAQTRRSPSMPMQVPGGNGARLGSGGGGGGMMPPFAGFGGISAAHLPGQPTSTVHTLNINALPHIHQPHHHQHQHSHHSAPGMGGLHSGNSLNAPYFVPPIAPQPSLNDLGRGVPLHALPSGGPLYIVEFKAGRTDLFYVDDPDTLSLSKGDLVVVEADRGKDLGKILTSCTLEEVREFQISQVESALGQLVAANTGGGGGHTIGGVQTLESINSSAAAAGTQSSSSPSMGSGASQAGAGGQSATQQQQPSAAAIARMTKEIHPKKIYGRASPADVSLLVIKAQDEQKALNVCRAKVAQHNLPMEVTDAEFQFDRRRLTFFYIASHRIDFRVLVKELFRLYKTRIWLCSIEHGQPQVPQQMGGAGGP